MLPPHPHDGDTALKVVISSSTALGVMMSDFLWLLRDEGKFVWPNLRSSWNARIYIFTRYPGLFSQIFNVYFTVRMFLGIHTSPAGCGLWFSYQAAVVQTLLFMVEWLLLRRVYLLFLRSRLILVVLISFTVGQVASMAFSASFSYSSHKYTVTCMMVKGNPGSVFFSTTTMATHVVIFFMTFWRYFQLPSRWTQTKMNKVFMRDSAVSLAAIICMLFFLTLSSLHVIKPIMSSNITYYWLVTILYVTIGRLIVGQAKILSDDQVEDSGTWAGSLQLTSQIEMGNLSMLSVDTESETAVDGQRPTPQASLSTSPTDVKQLSLSTATSGSDKSNKWLGDALPSHEDLSPRNGLKMGLAAEASLRRIWLAKIRAGGSHGGASQRPEDRPETDAAADEPIARPPSSIADPLWFTASPDSGPSPSSSSSTQWSS